MSSGEIRSRILGGISVIFLLLNLSSCNKDEEPFVLNEINSKKIGNVWYTLLSDSVYDISYGSINPLKISIEILNQDGDTIFDYRDVEFDVVASESNYLDHHYDWFTANQYVITWYVDCIEKLQTLEVYSKICDQNNTCSDSLLFSIEAYVTKPTSGIYRSCKYVDTNYTNLRILTNKDDLYLVSHDTIFHTTDPISENWNTSLLPEGLDVRTLNISNQGLLYADNRIYNDYHTIYTSNNKGLSWDILPAYSDVFYIDNEENYYSYFTSNVVVSYDQGNSWNKLFSTYEENLIGRIKAFYKDGDVLYAVFGQNKILSYTNGDLKVYPTINLGTTWSSPVHLEVLDNYAYVSSNNLNNRLHKVNLSSYSNGSVREFELLYESERTSYGWARFYENDAGDRYYGDRLNGVYKGNIHVTNDIEIPIGDFNFHKNNLAVITLGRTFYYYLDYK